MVMLGIAIKRDHRATVIRALAGLVATLVFAAVVSAKHGAVQVTSLLMVDSFALWYLGLTVLATIVVILLSFGYLEQQSVRRDEFYILLLTAALGSGVLAASTHFASFFLGLELLSVSLYGLISYQYERALNLEAGVKYLVLAGTSSAFLLFGMALVYSQTGELGLRAMASDGGLVVDLGWLLMLVAIGFKLALVPFHMWTPDIYQGAPAPVSAFVATVSKGAVFALLLRYMLASGPTLAPLYAVFALVAAASMLAGNLLALSQTNVKRILGYSSIAHMGYLLIALIAGGKDGATIASFYLVAYFLTMLGAFGVVTVLSTGERDAEDLADYVGLAQRRPWAAAVMTAMLLSLAGMPLTAGFMAKVYVVASGASTGHWALLMVLAIASAISLYYYLRIVMAMFSHEEGEEDAAVERSPVLASIALAALLVLLVWIGVYPGPMLGAIARVVALMQ
jgi:NADH-quinone oxidoreductase subunit N